MQDLSQLEKIYGAGWQTFIGNSGVLQYFGSRDHKTAEYFSNLCGVTTIVKKSITNAIANAIANAFTSSTGQGGGNSSSSTTLDIAQRSLAYPDELMVLRENKQLVLIENFNPIPGKKVIWYHDTRLNALGKRLQ